MADIAAPGKSPAEVLRELADGMDSEEIRTFYLFTVSKAGVIRNTLYVTPNRLLGPGDLMSMGEAAVQLCDKIDNTLQPKMPGLN